MTWFNVVSIIASIVTIVGFTLTLYQVWGVKKKVNGAVLDTKQHLQTIDALQIANKAEKQIPHILTSLASEEWMLAGYLVEQLYSDLLELGNIIGKKEELEYVNSKLPSVIYSLMEYASNGKALMSKDTIHNDIIRVQDYIKKYESILKTK